MFANTFISVLTVFLPLWWCNLRLIEFVQWQMLEHRVLLLAACWREITCVDDVQYEVAHYEYVCTKSSQSVCLCVFVCRHAIQQRTIRQQNEHFWRLQPGVVVVVLASICGNWAAQRVMVLPLCTTEHWTHWQMRRELVSAVGISHGRHYSTTSTLSLSLGQL